MRRALITGGAGFIGTNLAKRLAHDGWKVAIFDNLSRPGVEQNLSWLQCRFPSAIEFHNGDIRDAVSVARAVRGVDSVFHFAAQVAVTTSLVEPREDFEVNVGGTLNVLEAIRNSTDRRPTLLFTSTNKVYGGLNELALEASGKRYRPPLGSPLQGGIHEERPLDFHSPYGCSKGAADQYVLDYARSYALRTVVFRMSCVYGPHQMGTEDQGWIAHFLLQALAQEPIEVCGDGLQVRDVLFVDDLVSAFLRAYEKIEALTGRAFNLGGGRANTLSLLELLDQIEQLTGQRPHYNMQNWRAGDQRYYVSDTRCFQAATGWEPQVGVREGIKKLYAWLQKADSSRWAAAATASDRHALLTR